MHVRSFTEDILFVGHGILLTELTAFLHEGDGVPVIKFTTAL